MRTVADDAAIYIKGLFCHIMFNYKGVIFDVDGTLLDSQRMWDSVPEEYLKSRGFKPRSGLLDDLNKIGGHEIPGYFRTEYGLCETAEEIQNSIYEMMEEYYFYKAPLKKGVMDVLDALRDRDVKMCVATATDRYLVEPALNRCGILEYFGRVFSCREMKTSKRIPDIYIQAADFIGTEIHETLVVEDALYAIKSAKSAGFPVAGVYDLSEDYEQYKIKEICDYYFVVMDEMLELF
jgi:HAD superfamily hydrolase (TIGR01509 family)